MDHLNVKVGSVTGVAGTYGLVTRNERGDTLIEFCQEKELTITNTLDLDISTACTQLYSTKPNRRLIKQICT